MSKKKIQVVFQSQEYCLFDASRTPPLKIYATINGDNKTITLKPKHGGDHFKFFKSDPELAKGVINLMQEAVKLIPTKPKKEIKKK